MYDGVIINVLQCELVTYIYIYSRFTTNYEANASEFVENLEEMFSRKWLMS